MKTRASSLRMLSLAAAVALAGPPARAAEPAKRPAPNLTGLYYTKTFSEWLTRGELGPHSLGESVPLSLTFKPDGTLIIQDGGFAGMERTCRYRSQTQPTGLLLEVRCGGESSAWVKYHWSWRSPDEAETDLLKDAELPHPVVVRATKTFDALVREAEAAFHRKHLARLAGRYSSSDGLVLVIDAKGFATVGGRKVGLKIVECVTMEAPEHGQTACLLLDPRTSGEGSAGEWVAVGEGQGLHLREGLQAFETGKGVWPGGFEVKVGGRTLARVGEPAGTIRP